MTWKFRFNESSIRKLKAPDPSGKPTIVHDTETRGLAVLVSGKTDRKTYIVCFGTQFQRRTIGDVSLLTVEEARESAIDILKLMRKGIDPNTATKAAMQTASITLRQLFAMRLLDDKRPLRAASVKVYQNVFDKHLAAIADRPLSDITTDVIADLHQRIFRTARKGTGTEDGRPTADLALAIVRALFSFAARLKGSARIDGLPAVNPASGVESYLDAKAHKARVRETCIEEKGLARFWRALDDVPNATQATLIRIMLLTGLRIGTARQLRWEHVDFDNRLLRCPAELMKAKLPHALPLVDGLIEILRAWWARGVDRSGFVFASSVRGKCVVEVRPALEFIVKATGIDISAHDCRRTFAKTRRKAGITKWQMADLLHHTSGRSITDDYTGDADADDQREPMQKVVTYILARAGANVVGLPTSRERAA
jgi:integrase